MSKENKKPMSQSEMNAIVKATSNLFEHGDESQFLNEVYEKTDGHYGVEQNNESQFLDEAHEKTDGHYGVEQKIVTPNIKEKSNLISSAINRNSLLFRITEYINCLGENYFLSEKYGDESKISFPEFLNQNYTRFNQLKSNSQRAKYIGGMVIGYSIDLVTVGVSTLVGLASSGLVEKLLK